MTSWNPFTWFRWGVDWGAAVDLEIEIVKQLNAIFGTHRTRLDAFTPEERARIEDALGQKIDWDGGPIKASERELRIRDRVFLGSQISLVVSGVAVVGALGAKAAPLGAGSVTAGAAELGIGSKAVMATGLGAGTWPALLVNGKVYVARFHEIAWQMSARGEVQKYGMAIIDASGRVVGWK